MHLARIKGPVLSLQLAILHVGVRAFDGRLNAGFGTVYDLGPIRKHPETVEKNSNPKGPRTQTIGFQGPNTIALVVFGP